MPYHCRVLVLSNGPLSTYHIPPCLSGLGKLYTRVVLGVIASYSSGPLNYSLCVCVCSVCVYGVFVIGHCIYSIGKGKEYILYYVCVHSE